MADRPYRGYHDVLDVLNKTFVFGGRARRTGGAIYGIFLLPIFSSFLNLLPGIDNIEYTTMGNGNLASLLLSIPLAGWLVRRLHDFDCSGWRALPIAPFLFIPKGSFPNWIEAVIVLLIMASLLAITLMPLTSGANRYGPNPRNLSRMTEDTVKT